MPGTRRLEQLRRLRGGAAAHFGHRKMCQRVRRVLGHLRCVVQKQEKRKRKLIPNYFDFIFPSIPPRWIFNFSNSISSISSDSDIAIISQIIQLSSLSFIHKIIHFVVYKVTLEKNVKIIAGYHRQRVCSCHPFIHPFFSAKSLLSWIKSADVQSSRSPSLIRQWFVSPQLFSPTSPHLPPFSVTNLLKLLKS